MESIISHFIIHQIQFLIMEEAPMKKKVFFVLTLSLLLVMFFYCDKKNPVSNKAPVISSISATATNLDWGQIITLIANAEDPDGEELTFSWTSSGGSFTTDANKDTVSWQAPNASGSYTCTVEVSDGEDKTTKNIVLTVEEHPVLSTNADTLYFTTDLTSLSFDVTNTGTGVLDWSFTTTTDGGGSWITSASPSSGSLATGEVNAVSVGINRSGLSGGKYYGWINITSDDGSKNIRIIVDVASISVSPASLDFGEASTSMNLSMENGGAGTLTWTVTDDKDWLSVSPASGSTTTESDNIQVSVSRGGLSSGTYTGTITISEATTSNTATVSVSMQVTNPVLSVTPTSLDFGTASTAKSVSIKNAGGSTLSWTVYDNSSWISVSPSSGSTTSETDYVTVNVSRSGLAPGTYNGIVTVNSNGGTETISVTMDVPQPQGQWISYDDGSYEDILDAQPAWWYFFVQFDRPSGWTNFKVTKVKIKFSTSGSDGIKLLCYNT